jgi:sulfur relay (sulfurtransferase) DsrC/TusE family protein
MGWEANAAIVLAGAYLSIRIFIRLFYSEYKMALEARRLINMSRKLTAAKLRARMGVFEGDE